MVACPHNEEEIAALMDWAAQSQVALIPFGGGTSVVAGTEPEVGPHYAGTVSLDLEHLNQLLDVDTHAMLARLQAGAKGPHIEAQLGQHGLTLRHFPQSFEFSTLGGWIATRSGGHFATLYTHIDELVASARMVTPSGVLESPRLPASGAGPDPNRLMCGSEGVLGVITEAWMRVRPRPRWRSKATVHFTTFSGAVAAAHAIAQTELHPANCRVLDAQEAMLHGAGTGARHLLLLGFESASGPTHAWMERAIALSQAHGGQCPKPASHTDDGAAQDDRAAGAWRHAFLEAPYRFNSLVSLGVVVDTFETACTWDRFEALHTGVTQAVRDAMHQATGSPGWISCRFTHVYPDGPAPYYTFMAPGTPGRELEQWRAIKTAASEALLKHHGTITHHHAVGRLHKPWHLRQSPPLFTQVLKVS
ncbi:MAG: FAD-binding oxidoreductase [Myxococcota bacterium]